MSKIILFCLFAVLNIVSAKKNNVCSTFQDYSFIQFSKNCWYNPDVDLLVPDLIRRYGYPFEQHTVTTPDGYILEVFRVPYGRNNSGDGFHRQPVFLQHGLSGSSSIFLLNGNRSSVFYLADHGYDVWIGNSRGCFYSTGHTTLSVNDKQYWNFSYHEMGVQDSPSVLGMITEVTGRNDIIWIGQSMGSSIAFVYCSLMPEHCTNRLKLVVNLAPGVYNEYVRTPLRIFLPITYALETLSVLNGKYDVVPLNKEYRFLRWLFCLQSGFHVAFCESFMQLLFGIDYEQILPETLPVLLAHQPAGTSLKTMVHVRQNVYNGFRWYDYGKKLNQQYYNSETSPAYNISQIRVPNFIMYSVNDYLGTEKGAIRIWNEIPVDQRVGLFKIKNHKYNHGDTLVSKDFVPEIMDEMVKVMKNYTD